ncbi:hypothetical protein [Aquabacterium sp. OR-4]|uniref:hypothetical protein n=1 Tax=Aquabacterium sp. OR-4 TaxID=2978127 RepID=UPI0021B44411|nr:hypothetical protein [Aquabacterium sp. OR-4]MDT7834905.1 hypothetical protein [Aquabacterium sp. OR-4]
MNSTKFALTDWMYRLVSRRVPPSSSLMNTRIEVCPPELWPSSLGWRGTLRRWLDRRPGWRASRVSAPPPVDRLTQARSEFIASLADLSGDDPWDLGERIARARSLRELWHLRSRVYGVVAVSLNQSEAERRIERLNRHFPVRAQRTAPQAMVING